MVQVIKERGAAESTVAPALEGDRGHSSTTMALSLWPAPSTRLVASLPVNTSAVLWGW
jgi:hypothetical protein